MSNNTFQDEAASMFFDEEFNPASYIDALFNGLDYSKTNMNKLINISNKLITHLNFLVNQLNSEINGKLQEISKLTTETNLNNSTRLNYYLKLLQNSIMSLNEDLDVPEFKELVIINKLVNYKTVKQHMLETLKVLQFIKTNFSDLNIRNFETNLMKVFNSIMSLSDIQDKLDNLNYLVDCSDVFKNLNQFNMIYKKNLPKLTAERDCLSSQVNNV